MGDTVTGATSSRPREYSGEDCDETTLVCGGATQSREYTPVEALISTPQNDAKLNAEIARNMAKPKPEIPLDELTWSALRGKISELDASKADPTKLAACKRELERREGIAAEAKGRDVPLATSSWGPDATADHRKGLVGGSVSLATNHTGSVQIGNVGASVGGDTALSATAFRYTHTTSHGASTVDVASARTSIGVVNSDGSVGFHVAAQANVAAVEHTEKAKEGASATGGASDGVGFELSFGLKGAALCGRIGVGPVTLGGCTGAPGSQQTWATDKK